MRRRINSHHDPDYVQQNDPSFSKELKLNAQYPSQEMIEKCKYDFIFTLNNFVGKALNG